MSARYRDYLDFEIEIGSSNGQEYPVSVLHSPAGEARELMRFPYRELELASRLKDLQLALLRHSGAGPRRVIASRDVQPVQDFGQQLFNALLAGEVRSRYDISRRDAVRQGKGLRLKLRIHAPELAALPWEFMYDSRQAEYICLSRTTPLVRYLELPQHIPALPVEPPLHILGVVASPSDQEALNVAHEKQRIEEALKELQSSGITKLSWLSGQTWRDIQRAMQRDSWHILHFIGHGGFDRNSDQGFIALDDERGQTFRLPATELGRLLADHDPLRLVLLNSCLGAEGSELDIFSSTASILVRRGIPAVLAMQYEITDRAAIEFSRTFYEAVANEMPVDMAVAEARKAVSIALPNTVEWGTPVLYMRAPDGSLFNMQKQLTNDNIQEKVGQLEQEKAKAEAARMKQAETKQQTWEQQQREIQEQPNLQQQQHKNEPATTVTPQQPGLQQRPAGLSTSVPSGGETDAQAMQPAQNLLVFHNGDVAAMSASFAITPATNTLLLDPHRKGEASVTVSNLSGRAIRGRARLVPQQPEAAAWLKLVGEEEREFAIAATQQYTIQLAVPPTAPAGSYAFRLDMVGVENPDEELTKGEGISFTVPAPVVKPAQPPWLLIAALVAGLVIMGSVGGFLFWQNQRAQAAAAATQTFITGETQIAIAQSTATQTALAQATATQIAIAQAAARYTGVWNKESSQSAGITKLEVSSSGPVINVQATSEVETIITNNGGLASTKCNPTCTWVPGSATYTRDPFFIELQIRRNTVGGGTGIAQAIVQQPVHQLRFTLLQDGRLSVVETIMYRGNQVAGTNTYTFKAQ